MTPIDSVGRHGTRQAGILASVSSCHWRRILSLSGGIRWCRLQRKRGEFRRTSSSKPAAKEFSLFLTVRTNQARIPLCEHTRRLDHRLKDDSKMFRHTSLSHMEQHLRVRDHPYSEKATSFSTATMHHRWFACMYYASIRRRSRALHQRTGSRGVSNTSP